MKKERNNLAIRKDAGGAREYNAGQKESVRERKDHVTSLTGGIEENQTNEQRERQTDRQADRDRERSRNRVLERTDGYWRGGGVA